MDKQISIKEVSTIELKAIKSDIYETIQKAQKELSIINQELNSRIPKVQEKKNMEEETKVEETPVETTEVEETAE